MAGNDKIKDKGFDKNPQNINKKGRPKKLISTINADLKEEGYTPAKQSEIVDAYLTLVNLPMSKIIELSKKENDDYPILFKLVAKEILGKNGANMLEKILDRGIGKPQQAMDLSSKDGSMSPIKLTPEAAKAIAKDLDNSI